MLKRHSSPPKYSRHKASGQARVLISGKHHYLGPYGSPESREKYARLVAEHASPSPKAATSQAVGDDVGITVVELVAAFTRHANEYYRRADGSVTDEVANIRQSVRPLVALYGRTPAADFGPLRLQAVRKKMIDDGLARTTINRQVDRIKRVFKWAVANEVVPPSVFHGLQSVAGLRVGRSGARETEPVKPVPREFVDAVLPHVSEPIAAMIRLQLLTGCRPGEVLVMRACDLDTSGSIWIYTPAKHKNAHRGHSRTIYLGPKAQVVVKEFLTMDTTAYLFSPQLARESYLAERRANRKTPMTPSHAARKRKRSPKRAPREHYSVHSYARAIRRACELAEVPAWSPHRLRHSAATELRKEFGVDVARVVLGHRSAAVTEVYAELDREKALDVMAKVG